MSVGTTVQEDAHPPHTWRELTAAEQAQFDIGYAVFNTEWVPANTPAGRIDGLGPIFNSQGCDACHNSRRRGRGPQGDGEAPSDLVLQISEQARRDYGFVMNTAATAGFKPEGQVLIHYDTLKSTLPDGSVVELRAPHYQVAALTGPALSPDVVLMPRLPPAIHGVGLLERVPQSELEEIVRSQRHDTAHIRGRISWLADGGPGKVIGRFGWRATEPTVASQTAVAMAREMGLTTPLVDHDDCGEWNVACRTASSGGTPEVEPALFDALLAFESWQSVPVARAVDESALGARLFESSGCGLCHRASLRVELQSAGADHAAADHAVIHPYTDLLLHDMGKGLADRNSSETLTAPSLWRTAPLWGLNAAYARGQAVRLLHDGRARSIEEAILWHDGEARDVRDRYSRLTADQRRTLSDWISKL